MSFSGSSTSHTYRTGEPSKTIVKKYDCKPDDTNPESVLCNIAIRTYTKALENMGDKKLVHEENITNVPISELENHGINVGWTPFQSIQQSKTDEERFLDEFESFLYKK